MKKWQLIGGGFLILMGLGLLVKTIFGISIWAYLFPLAVIGAGLLFIFRPQMAGSDTQVNMMIFGDHRREGVWDVNRSELWVAIGSAKLDFSQANIPDGDTTIKIFGLINDVVLKLPDSVAAAVECGGLINTLKTVDSKQDQFFETTTYQTPAFETASRRVLISVAGLINDVKIKPGAF